VDDKYDDSETAKESPYGLHRLEALRMQRTIRSIVVSVGRQLSDYSVPD
jgi:hypothetical protein